MMNLTSCLLALAALNPGSALPSDGLVAIRVDRAETIANGTLEHAVILVDGGKIVTIGEDLPIERGIPVIDLPAGYVVLPGLVNCYSRVGMDGNGPAGAEPQRLASRDLYPAAEEYAELVEAGITTLGQYPAGNGIPGQAVAVRPVGATPDEMVVADSVYLKVILRASKTSKKMLSSGFESLDEYLEKEKKNREKWEEKQEKKKSKKKSKKKDDDEEDEDKDKDDEDKGDDDKAAGRDDDDKKKDKEEEEDVYEPVELKPEVEAFMKLRDGDLRALVSISQAADYLHFLDALGDEEVDWDLRIPLTRDIDVFHITDKVGETGRRVVLEPTITLQPGTMRQRNLPAEFARAGAKIVFIPRSDSVEGQRDWRRHAGEMVAAGLDPQVALRAMTLEPAELMGLGERTGSLEEGKDANLLILDGDPFEPGTKVKGVMIEGDFVHGEVNQ